MAGQSTSAGKAKAGLRALVDLIFAVLTPCDGSEIAVEEARRVARARDR